MALSKESMAAKIKAKIAAVPPYQGSDAADAQSYRDAVMLAMCEGIIEEIVQNSELVPIETDSGTAGSGIITGKVK